MTCVQILPLCGTALCNFFKLLHFSELQVFCVQKGDMSSSEEINEIMFRSVQYIANHVVGAQ